VVGSVAGEPLPGGEPAVGAGDAEIVADATVQRGQERPDGDFRTEEDVLRKDVRGVQQRAAGHAQQLGHGAQSDDGGHAQPQAAGVLCGPERVRLWVLRADGVRGRPRGDAPQHERVLHER